MSFVQLSWKRAGAGGNIDPHSINLDVTSRGVVSLTPLTLYLQRRKKRSPLKNRVVILPPEKEQTFPIEEQSGDSSPQRRNKRSLLKNRVVILPPREGKNFPHWRIKWWFLPLKVFDFFNFPAISLLSPRTAGAPSLTKSTDFPHLIYIS